jgi:MFS family permease
MTNWLSRGLAFAGGMVLLRLVQGTLINLNPTRAGIISTVLLVLFGIAAFAWGLLDGRADAEESPDPDRRRDLAMRWLVAGLIAGVLGGAVVWLISLVYRNLYADGLIHEVTAFAAFTALMVFLPATAGVALGRRQVDRSRVDEPRRRAEDGSDVFDAVRTGPLPAASGAGAAAAVDYPAQVALAEREEREGATEQIARQIEDETERISAEIDDIADDRK